MKRYLVGIFLFSQSLFILALLIGIATVAQCCDKTGGSYFTSVYDYISTWQWLLVAIPACIGILICIYEMVHTSNKDGTHTHIVKKK